MFQNEFSFYKLTVSGLLIAILSFIAIIVFKKPKKPTRTLETSADETGDSGERRKELEKRRTKAVRSLSLRSRERKAMTMKQRVECPTTILEKFSEATLCLCDIVGFNTISDFSEPEDLFSFLNDLYSAFDKVIAEHEVCKLVTISGAYLIVGGVREGRVENHAEVLCSLAMHLLHISSTFKIQHLPGVPVRLRTGIHTGPVLSGMMEATLSRHYLLGDTVMDVAILNSTSKGNRIQVSCSTREKLHNGFNVVYRGHVEEEGRELPDNFWLLGKEDFELSLPEWESVEDTDSKIFGEPYSLVPLVL